MRKLARATGAGLLLCLGAASPSEAQWRRIDSPNFVVIGDVGEGTLRDVAVKFEAFREMLGRVLGERVLATPVPTVVLVFPNERALTPFKTTFDGKPVELSGLFVGQRDINYIAVVSDGQPDRFRTVFHEFVHLVVSNMEVPVPAWLNEGLAEYYSTFEIYKDGREAILGNPIDHHLGRLKETPLLPLDQLLSVDHESPLYNEGNKRSLFYAQSWALTHLILLGQPARTDELNAYVKQLSQGVPVTQAWQQAFGAADIARQLEIYVRRQSFKAYQFKFTDKLASFDVAATKLPGADAAAFLTDFLVRQDRLDESAARVAAATKLDPDNARLKIVAAEIDVARRDYDAAHARLRSLGASADWLTAYLAGVAVAELNEKKPGRPEPQDVEAARHFFDIAAGDRPPFANALARMAFLDLSTGSVPSVETRAAIERARSVAPGRKEYTFIHAQVLARQSDFAAARGVISPLLTTAYPEETRAAARRVMSDIADLESVRAAKDLRARAAAAATVALPPPIMTDKPGAPSSPSADGKPANLPSPTRHWSYRNVQAGEQRLEGTLDRIDCGRDGRPVFNVKTETGVVRFVAARLSAVELITYRADLSGAAECGPFKQAIPVYVTWRPAGDGSAAKIAIAIEFLPNSVPPAVVNPFLRASGDSVPTTAAPAPASTR